MAPKGFKSVTVRQEVYDELLSDYKKEKKEMIKRGVNSFSGYVTYRLNELVEEKRKRAQQPSNP